MGDATDQLELLKNEESCYVCAEDDDGIDRIWHCADCCPDPDNCSKSSWKKSACWNYASEHQVKMYVLHHLHEKHELDGDMAQAIANITEISHRVETAKERANYRKQCDKQTEHVQQPTPKNYAHSRSPHVDRNAVAELNQNIKSLVAGLGPPLRPAPKGRPVQHAHSGASGSTRPHTVFSGCSALQSGSTDCELVPAQRAGHDVQVSISVRDFQILLQTLQRAAFATSSGLSMMRTIGQQFEVDARVIDQAKKVVEGIMAKVNMNDGYK